MANFLFRENLDNLSDDSMRMARRSTPPAQPGYVDPTYPAKVYLDDQRSQRSIRRMKILTAISVAVTLTVIVQHYARQDLNHSPRSRASQASLALPRTQTVPSPLPSQNAPQNPTEGPFIPEHLLTASKGEVISAIQEPIRDTDLARTLNRARAGDIAAQYNMGLRFADGNGVPQNYALAMTWFMKASEGGNPEGQLKLVLGYINGIGVPRDEHQALMWLKRAANSGNTWAERALSNLYLTGQSVPRDYVRAYTWAKIASELAGNDSDEVRLLRSRMTQVQIADAERRISIWKHDSQQKPVKYPSDRPYEPVPQLKRPR
jgi:Sel1 repeat